MLEKASLKFPGAPVANFSSSHSVILDVPLKQAFDILGSGTHLEEVSRLSPISTAFELGDTASIPVAPGSLPISKNLYLLDAEPGGLDRTWFRMHETAYLLGIRNEVSF